tara:strand:+ start:1229 stop:1435 length:207 start_codon:yes stop_codon:yes gene_type:complete
MSLWIGKFTDWYYSKGDEPKPHDSEENWDDWVVVPPPVEEALSKSMFSTSFSEFSKTIVFENPETGKS